MTTTSTTAYWDLHWAGGRRYRQFDGPEQRLMDEYLGPSRGRPALDLGCGDGALARHLHHELGYRTTGIDISPSAVAPAADDEGPAPGPAWQCADITTSDLTGLPEPPYAVITCRRPVSPAETEILTFGWSAVQTADLDVLRCYALRH
ncbi:class I SAM-dependent methyltransferase [Streptomyces sp. LaBMicrA B280]|uniref:class I SAM-dependent methyltransferase n=1 Tax=Streptomyces sp. LaBMicrA B280 TaxID=3391001 RepID=UPI003BA7354B